MEGSLREFSGRKDVDGGLSEGQSESLRDQLGQFPVRTPLNRINLVNFTA